MHATLQASLRAALLSRSAAEPAGPFLVAFDPDSDSPFRNYAVPDADARPTDRDIDELCRVFRRRNLPPRLEFLPRAAPAVLPALTAAGFVVEDRLAIMTCAQPQLRPPMTPVGVETQLVANGDALREAAAAQNAAYGAGPVSDADVGRLRRTVESGGIVALAREIGGGAVGAGLVAPLTPGLAELGAVGVVPAWRRRGVAGSLTGLLARAAFDAGIPTLMLMAYDAEQSIYARAGFTISSEIVFASLSP